MKKQNEPITANTIRRSDGGCECIDALHSKEHQPKAGAIHGCTRPVAARVILRRVPTTHNRPLAMCADCAKFAEMFCHGEIVRHS